MNLDPRDLFDRARAGDQNAMKDLVAIREGAARGDPDYRRAFDALTQYGREHPMHGEIVTSMTNCVVTPEERHALGILRAADQNDPRTVMEALHHIRHSHAVRAACVALSRQQPWTDPRIGCFEGLLPDEPRRAVFREAVRVAPDKGQVEAIRRTIPSELQSSPVIGSLCAGYCFGTARKFQIARMPDKSVSVIGADIGWECGL